MKTLFHDKRTFHDDIKYRWATVTLYGPSAQDEAYLPMLAHVCYYTDDRQRGIALMDPPPIKSCWHFLEDCHSEAAGIRKAIKILDEEPVNG